MSAVPGVLFSTVEVSESGACELVNAHASCFFRRKQCAHGACVHRSSAGTLGTVDSAVLLIHN